MGQSVVGKAAGKIIRARVNFFSSALLSIEQRQELFIKK